jgi:hypothetical protein
MTTVAPRTAASHHCLRHASHAATLNPPPIVAHALPAWVTPTADRVSPGIAGANLLEMTNHCGVGRKVDPANQPHREG